MPVQSRATSLGEPSSLTTGKKNNTKPSKFGVNNSATEAINNSSWIICIFFLTIIKFSMKMLSLHLEMEFLDVNIMINAEDIFVYSLMATHADIRSIQLKIVIDVGLIASGRMWCWFTSEIDGKNVQTGEKDSADALKYTNMQPSNKSLFNF